MAQNHNTQTYNLEIIPSGRIGTVRKYPQLPQSKGDKIKQPK